jgi:hypothetical protein
MSTVDFVVMHILHSYFVNMLITSPITSVCFIYEQPPSGPPGASAGSAPQTLIGNSSFGVPPQQPHQLYQSEAHLSSCISRPHNLSL